MNIPAANRLARRANLYRSSLVATPAVPTAAAPGRRRWLGLAVLSLGVSMIIVDATVVNVAIPTIIGDLGLQGTDAEWLNTIYALVFAALLISVGRAGDRWGRRLFFLVGVAVFVLSSLWAAQAWSPQSLIAARFVQGIGGAMILPATLSSVNAMFQGPARAIAFGVWGSVIGGMAALGPLLGGYLTTEHSWRWIFYINLPIGVLVAIGALALVPETKDPSARRGADPWGVATVSLGLGALVFAIIEGQRYGWLRPTAPFTALGMRWPLDSISVVLPAIAAGVLLLAAFLTLERHRGRAGHTVVVDLSLFRLRSFRNGNLAALVVSLGEFGLIFVLPLFLQSVLGYSAFRTGVVLVALASGAFVAGGPAATLARRYGSRPVVLAGMAAEAIGLAATVPLLSTSATGWTLAGPLFLYGLGVGLATAQLTNAILVDVPPEASGQASGIQSTFRQVGSALGIAVLGTLLIVGLGTGTAARLAQVPGLPPEARQGITTAVRESAGAVLPALRGDPGTEAAVGAVEDAFVASARTATAVAAAFILAGLVAAARLPGRRPSSAGAGEA
ncbi:MAG TPA: DHA2 family efflux MFS transporter permease subunit [Acidimicrobiia bacterium]|nr:DHA2 family efflux MFS transporter permease subunit [Acidimicrobiia bacterium]